MLQETSTHPDGGSLVVFATVDVDAIQVTMSGEDPSYILLLPLGFAIFPATNPSPAATSTSSSNGESSPGNTNEPANGCLLTVGMQVLASAVPSAKLNLSSVTAINSHVCNAIHQITTALKGQGAGVSGFEQRRACPCRSKCLPSPVIFANKHIAGASEDLTRARNISQVQASNETLRPTTTNIQSAV